MKLRRFVQNWRFERSALRNRTKIGSLQSSLSKAVSVLLFYQSWVLKYQSIDVSQYSFDTENFDAGLFSLFLQHLGLGVGLQKLVAKLLNCCFQE